MPSSRRRSATRCESTPKRPNDASVRLHEAFGFEPVGVYREVGFKHGAWRDVGWWRLGLSDDPAPPKEPVAFADLRESEAVRTILR